MSITLQRTSRALTAMLIRWPFFGHLGYRLIVVVDNSIPTAATDGKFIYFNDAYVAGLTDRQLIGLYAHEIMHCAMLHFTRAKGRNHNLWNLACDYAIDQIIINAGMEVPDATVNPEWKGWTAEMIYNALVNDKSKQKKARDQVLPPSGGTGQTTKGGKSSTPQDIEDLKQDWRSAVLSAATLANGRGQMPGGMEMLIEELKEPAVDWRSELLRFMQQTACEDYTWRIPNRRHSGEFFLPSLISPRMPPLVLANDVSGSLWTPKMQSLFASETQAAIDVCRPEATYLVDCDSRVRNTKVVDPDEPIDFKRVGGGGTRFEPVFDWVEEQQIEPACLIYLTDLDGSFPKEEPPYPVLWASTNKRKKAPFGETLYITE